MIPQPPAPLVSLHQPFGGIFTVRDAALYFRATTPPTGIVRLDEWRARRTPILTTSSRRLHSWIRHGYSRAELAGIPRADLILDFADLVRLRMIIILRSRGLSFAAIEDVETEAVQLTGNSNPFVTEEMWTSGSDVFVKFADRILVTRHGGQFVLDFLYDYLTPIHHGLRFGAGDEATAWATSANVIIDPAIQFGAPCLEGTRIPTEAIWAFSQAGDLPTTISKMYGITIRAVEDALRWERQLEKAAA